MSVSEQKGQNRGGKHWKNICVKDPAFILDNCEHLIEACAKISQAILKSVPNVKILASSSRESLGVSGGSLMARAFLQRRIQKNLPEFNQLT
ncbi:MAG: hypothetical protein IPN96_12030 [Anaerolineales bacterium]|nr:hypothetical protein [Anaerolineales bacterium]